MATRTQGKVKEIITEAPQVEKKGLAWLWLTLLSLVALILLISVLHMSGLTRGAEESIYAATRNVPVVNWFTGWMHQEPFEQNISLEEMVDAKDIKNNLVRAEGEISRLKNEIKQLNESIAGVEDVGKRVEKLSSVLKEMQDTGEMPAGIDVGGLPDGTAAPQAAASAAPINVPTSSGDNNYRLVGKIFEKIEPDTAVDILSNLTDTEKVSILGAMKEGTVAEILSALDPAKSADLTRMLAAAKK